MICPIHGKIEGCNEWWTHEWCAIKNKFPTEHLFVAELNRKMDVYITSHPQWELVSRLIDIDSRRAFLPFMQKGRMWFKKPDGYVISVVAFIQSFGLITVKVSGFGKGVRGVRNE